MESNKIAKALGATAFVTSAGFLLWLYGPPSPYFGWDVLLKTHPGINNRPSLRERMRLRYTAAKVSPLYRRIGPYVVSSGYRGVDLENAVTGWYRSTDRPSPHAGWAIDIVPTSMTIDEWWDRYMASVLSGETPRPYQGINERDHVHLDYRVDATGGQLLSEPTEGNYVVVG